VHLLPTSCTPCREPGRIGACGVTRALIVQTDGRSWVLQGCNGLAEGALSHLMRANRVVRSGMTSWQIRNLW
jgi:hypothetical protein